MAAALLLAWQAGQHGTQLLDWHRVWPWPNQAVGLSQDRGIQVSGADGAGPEEDDLALEVVVDLAAGS